MAIVGSMRVVAQRSGNLHTTRESRAHRDVTRLPEACAGQPGNLDTSFNGTGKVTAQVVFAGTVQSVAVGFDGKIVAAGYGAPSQFYAFAVARFNPDGSLDTTFNGTGSVTMPIGSNSAIATSVAIQSDNKIVVAGYSRVGSTNDFTLVRLNVDGSLDTTFNGTGIVTTPVRTGNDYIASIAIQSDGRIVAAGAAYLAGNLQHGNFALVRYNVDGSLDTTFNGTGKVTTPIGTIDGFANAIKIQPNGKIVAAGAQVSTGYDFALARYNNDGTLDTAFNGTGVVSTPVGSDEDSARSVAIQSDGKIVAAGSSIVGQSQDHLFSLVRYNSDGSLDNTFNGTGKVMTSVGGTQDFGTSVAIRSDGEIVMAGYSLLNGSNEDIALAFFLPNGTLDTSVNTTGKVLTPIGSGDDMVYSIALQPDGKIVAAGGSEQSASNYNFALVRYFGAPCSTAAGVEVSGRVLTAEGRGVTNARVTITDDNGTDHSTTTGRRGTYALADVEAGHTYVISVDSRRFHYATRVLAISDRITGLDFIPEP